MRVTYHLDLDDVMLAKNSGNQNLHVSEKLQSDLIFYIEKFQDLIKKLILTLFENHLKCPIWKFGIFLNFCPIQTNLSGNTVWLQASGYQKVAKMDYFLALLFNFCPLKI